MKQKHIRFLLCIVFVALQCRAANAFYGFAGDPKHQEQWQESTLIPENAYQLKLRQPDGVERIIQRDPVDSHAMICPSPWVGEFRGSQAIVMTEPGFSGGQTGFLFERGILRRLILDGTEYSVAEKPVTTSTIESLWPSVTETMVREATERHSVHWENRFRLWYKNPNRAAMLMVELALSCAFCLLLRPLWIKLLSLPFFLLLLAGVVKTNSRGGFVAFLAAAVCCFVLRFKCLLTLRRIIGVVLLFSALGGYVWYAGALDRFTAGLLNEGYTDVSRIPIWIEAPRMMISSFWGWGLGESGNVYMNWFQPLDRFHCVAGLINSHLTWLVEFGWPARVAYVFGWMSVLVFLAVTALRGHSVAPLAIWMAFFVGSIFNSLELDWTLWVVPILVFGVSLILTVRKEGARVFLVPVVIGGLLTAVVLGALCYVGLQRVPETIVHGDSKRVVVNGAETTTWIVDDGQVLSGGYYGILGKEVRHWYKDHQDAPPVGFVKCLEAVPADVKRLVLTGKRGVDFLTGWESNPEKYKSVDEVIFLSPSFGWKSVPLSLLEARRVRMVIGSFVARLPENSGVVPSWVKTVPGCALYINGWLRYVAKQ